MRILKFLGYGFLILFAFSIVGRLFSSSPSTSVQSSYDKQIQTTHDQNQTAIQAAQAKIAKQKPQQRDIKSDFDREMNQLMTKPDASRLASMCGHQREHAEEMAALNHKSEEEQQIIGFKTAMNCLDSVLGHKEHFPNL